jgi:hypothetical protein
MLYSASLAIRVGRERLKRVRRKPMSKRKHSGRQTLFIRAFSRGPPLFRVMRRARHREIRYPVPQVGKRKERCPWSWLTVIRSDRISRFVSPLSSSLCGTTHDYSAVNSTLRVSERIPRCAANPRISVTRNVINLRDYLKKLEERPTALLTR